MTEQTVAGKWILENPKVTRSGKNGWRPRKIAKTKLADHLRKKAISGFTVKGFVEESRSYRGAECLFVPGALKDRPARVQYLGRTMTASRYMTLLTHGTPKQEDAVSRHLCGNGHLSCINPEHLVWGSTADNIADMVKHRKAETVQERIYSVSGKL